MKAARISLPFYVWPLAVVLGLLIAGGSLSYSPEGRINVLWVWLLWAGLPVLGSVASLVLSLFGSGRPWIFRWRNKSIRWYPSREQRMHMMWLLQLFWCWLAAGMLLGYLVLLLFSDLAFGWSSTLIDDTSRFATALQALAWPWQAVWPAAVPSAELVQATQFHRINPAAADASMAGHWWRFLMASLLFYNLLPRVLLAAVFYARWRLSARPEVQVRGRESRTRHDQPDRTLAEDVLDHWHQAARVTWELQDPTAVANFGLTSWADDETNLEQLLRERPEQLLWQVNAERSPVAELGDLVARARAAGVKQQALWPRQTAETEPERHLASWRAFARQQQLIWIAD